LAGKTFTVAGRNFNAPGLVVRVCDVEAEWTLLPGGEELEVDAPACASTGWQALEVCTNYGCDSEAMGFFYAEPAATLFVRGDANDDGLTDISDPLSIVFDLFLERPAPAPCRDALDADDSGAVNLADAVALLDFLFLNGAVVPLPFPQPGADPTADPLPSC
jgi:hypothetical protein